MIERADELRAATSAGCALGVLGLAEVEVAAALLILMHAGHHDLARRAYDAQRRVYAAFEVCLVAASLEDADAESICTIVDEAERDRTDS